MTAFTVCNPHNPAQDPPPFPTLTAAEAFARAERPDNGCDLLIQQDGVTVGICRLDWQSRTVVDMTAEGAQLA